MGILSRSTSMTRYRVRGELEGNFWDAVSEGIKKGAYRKAQTPGELVGQGFVSHEDFTDYAFTGSGYVHGNYVVLGFRTDRARISARILEMELRSRTKKILEETGRARLSSAQRRELKDNIRETLYSQPFPAVSIQVNDLVWDTTEGVLYFTSTSQKAREELERWFKHCFGLTLTPLIPYLRGAELAGMSIAATLENTNFISVLQEQARVGRDFLKWLWFRSEKDGGVVPVSGGNALLVMLMDWLTLVNPDAESQQRVTVRGAGSELREGMAALQENKQLQDLRICIRDGGDDYEMTINAPWLTMNGLRIPLVFRDPEKTDADNDEGMLLEKVAVVETAWSLLDALFAEFCRLRISAEWAETELPAMQKWVEEAA